MRCEECLGVIEEYFDGATDERTSEQLGAHLAACAECAAALDSLGFEQEVYMRYERELEVTPALWQGVRAGIARTQIIEEAEKPLPLITRLREQIAFALGALAVRPALASSMALVVVGVITGVLWFGRGPQPIKTQTPELARAENPNPANPNPAKATAPSPGPNTPDAPQPNPSGKGEVVPAGSMNSHTVARHAAGAGSDGRAEAAISVPPADAGDVIVSLDEHPIRQDDPVLALLPTQLSDPADVITTAELADPEQKEVARHVEKAQMLLRSFRNVDYSKGEAAAEDLAYEKKLSRTLLDENVSLQHEAETAGNKEAGRVLNSLEPFLLDISNLRDKPSREEVRSIKERMEKKEIIAALQVY